MRTLTSGADRVVAVLAAGAVAVLAPVPARAGHQGGTCAASFSARHTACVDVSGSSVSGSLRNDDSGAESCGRFHLNLTTYDRNGHRFENAGDQMMTGCLAAGQPWKVTFPYVDPSQDAGSYGSDERSYHYTQMCVKGYRALDGEPEELVTGSACHQFPSSYDH